MGKAAYIEHRPKSSETLLHFNNEEQKRLIIVICTLCAISVVVFCVPYKFDQT